MDDTPKPGETVAPKAPENNANPQAPIAPPSQGNASDQGEVDRLRAELKELQQKAMRVNQVENELAKVKQAQEEADRAKLEEQNQFKELYEQEKAKLEAVEAERESEEKRKAIGEAKKKVLADFSDDVKALAEETGIDLTSEDEADVTAFKEKLDKINTKLTATSKIGANNPLKPSANSELSSDELKIALKDPAKFHEIISKRPGIARMMTKR